MEIRELKSAIALARKLNFHAAAKSVNISQPAFSIQIKKLEDSLGFKLFERSNRKVSITAQGKAFLPDAIRILELLERKAIDAKEISHEISGVFKLGAIPTIGPYLIPRILKKIRKTAPKLTLQLFEEPTLLLTSSIKQNRLDLGILALPLSEKGIKSNIITEEKFLLAVSKDNPIATRNKITLSQLKKERLLILQEGHCLSEQSLEYCKMSRLDPHVVFQGSSLTSLLKLTSAGEGVTLIPNMALSAESYPHLKFIPFQGVNPVRKIGVIWKSSATYTSAHKLIASIIEDQLLNSH